MKKVLVDTNVWLSAALRDRLPERVIQFIATDSDWTWLVTPAIVDEYLGVLQRPKFDLTPETMGRWKELLDLRTVVVGNPPTTVNFPRDPKDTPFLAAALATNADYLITGDKDLLQIGKLTQTHIITVAAFAAQFQIP